jgi:hypothetical protein
MWRVPSRNSDATSYNEDRTDKQRLVGVGLIALGAGMAVNAILGPLVLRVMRFHNSASGINQLIGGEAVSLVVVAPLSVAAGALWLRGQKVAASLALAPSLYALYTYTTEVIGAQYRRFPGNSEYFMPLHIGLLVLSDAIAVQAIMALKDAPQPVFSPRSRIVTAVTLLVPNALFALAWLGQLAAYASGEHSQAYQDDPILWWLIKALDLGIVIPVSLATGIGLLRNRPAASKDAAGLTGFLACLVGSVGAMGAVQLAKHDPAASPVFVAIGMIMGLAAAGVATHLVRAVSVHEGRLPRRTAAAGQPLG